MFSVNPLSGEIGSFATWAAYRLGVAPLVPTPTQLLQYLEQSTMRFDPSLVRTLRNLILPSSSSSSSSSSPSVPSAPPGYVFVEEKSPIKGQWHLRSASHIPTTSSSSSKNPLDLIYKHIYEQITKHPFKLDLSTPAPSCAVDIILDAKKNPVVQIAIVKSSEKEIYSLDDVVKRIPENWAKYISDIYVTEMDHSKPALPAAQILFAPPGSVQ